MFRKLFGAGGGETPPPAPEYPWELKSGDFLKLRVTAPEGLSAEELQVVSVHALDLGGPHMDRRVLTAETGDGAQYLLWKSDDGQVAFAREILRPVVEQVFDVEEIGALFEQDGSSLPILNRRAEPLELAGWTTALYRQEVAIEAYRHNHDPKKTEIGSDLTDDAQSFDFYRLVGDKRQFALEAMVLDGGRTNIYLISYLSTSTVEEMWQA